MKKVQRKKLSSKKVTWINSLNKLQDGPNIFLANEFFDSLPIKQFIKKNKRWFENKVKATNTEYFELIDTLTNIKKLEKKNWN